MNTKKTVKKAQNPALNKGAVSTSTSKNDFIINCLIELGFQNYLGKDKIYIRYDPGWDYTTKITLLENKNGYYTNFNLESSYDGSAKILGGNVPYNKMGIKSIFYIAQLPLSLKSVKGLGYGIR